MAKDDKKQPKEQSRAAEVSKQVARRGAKETRKAARRFVNLVGDTTKTLFGVGQRRVNRRNNRTTVGRYINDIITLAETSHLTGLKVNLSEVLVEPRFLALPEVEEPIGEDEVVQEVFYVIPRVPDYPQMLGAYNLPSYRIPELAVGHRRLAILGTSGSGRTTALMAIALWALREVQFPEKDDPVKQKLAEELEQLDKKEREKRERQREEALAAAKEALESAIERGEVARPKATSAAEAHAEDEESEQVPLPSFETLTPLYIHLGDLNITAQEFGDEVDPAEPFMRALQRSVSTLSARTIPRLVYERLETNQALILMDGYDELPPAERQRVQAWLRVFLKQYGDNFIVTTGPALGYGPLVQQGFTPLFIKPWSQQERAEAIEKWAEAFPLITGTQRKPGPEIGMNAQKRVAANSNSMNPAEFTIKLWAAFSDEKPGYAFIEWLEIFIKGFLPPKQNYIEILPMITNAAALQTDLGFITRQGLEVLFKEQEASGSLSISQEALQEIDAEQQTLAESDTDESDELEDEDEATAQRTRLLRTLIFAGLLRRYRGGRYRFRHSILADYYASLTLRDLPTKSPETLFDLAMRPNWKRPFMFAAQHTELDDVVRMKLQANPDVLHTDLLDMAQWLAYAAEDDIPWRGEILKRLGNAFVSEDQFVANRERITCALVASRDTEGAMNIFEYGLKSDDPDVQRLSCLGAGAMGLDGARLVDPISELAASPVEEVQIAVAHAMGALQTAVAKQVLAEILLEGNQKAQQAAGEAMAAMPEEGYATLYEAIEHDEMFVRRAAVFGLRRIETQWAQELIRSRFMTEHESFVHLLVAESFLQQLAGLIGPPAPPNADDVEWVHEWAEIREVQLPSGEKSNVTLAKSLGDENEEIRRLGAVALGQLGVPQATKLLYARLTDPDPVVRDAAYKALVELQAKMGETLPDPL